MKLFIKREIKVVIIGNYSTGKTTLTEKLITGNTIHNIESTIGCAFRSTCKQDKKGDMIKFQFWDTAGQERYRAITKLYYRNADIILLCFDISNQSSIDEIDNWYKVVKEQCINPYSTIILVANKCDLKHSIKLEMINNLKENSNIPLIYTSSFKNIGINQLMDTIIGSYRPNPARISHFNNILVKPKSPTNRCCYF